MLSRQGTTFIPALVLGLALSLPATALEPDLDRASAALAVCEEMREDLQYYHGLYVNGGNARQMAVWKKKYKRHIQSYGRSNCQKLYKSMMRRLETAQPRQAAPKTTS